MKHQFVENLVYGFLIKNQELRMKIKNIKTKINYFKHF
jgi:hypothetical protein